MVRLLIALLVVLVFVEAGPAYQIRRLYYGEEDNVCLHGEISDQV
jgi:hypothetical protein